jgi:RNA polymerase sigma-70 factor (ECF subfamily)
MTDAELISRIKSRDRESFDLLYDRYAQIIFNICIRILREDSEAEEVTQEIFVQIWKEAERFDASRASVKTWLFTIARSRSLDRYRSRKSTQKRIEPGQNHLEQISDAPDLQANSLMQQYVSNALLQLSREQRTVLELSYYEGLTQEEIAERLNEPLGTVKSRIRAALIKLRSLFAGKTPTNV